LAGAVFGATKKTDAYIRKLSLL